MENLKHFKYFNGLYDAYGISIEKIASDLSKKDDHDCTSLESCSYCQCVKLARDLFAENFKHDCMASESCSYCQSVLTFKIAYKFFDTGDYDGTLSDLLQSCNFYQCVSTETLKHFIRLCLKETPKNIQLILQFLKSEFVPVKFTCCKVHNENIIELMNNFAFSLGIKATSNGLCSAKAAAHAGQLDCLIYLRQFVDFNTNTIFAAVKGRSLECLKYLIESGCKPDKSCMIMAVKIGDIEIVKFLHHNGCELDESIARTAAYKNHSNILEYLETNKCEMNFNTVLAAVEGKSLECLIFLLQNGCETSQFAFFLAASVGHLEIFTQLHLNDENYLTESVARSAAGAGRLEILQYFYANGGVWDYSATRDAVTNGSMDCLKFLIASGCEFNYTALCAAVTTKNLEFVNYLIELGCDINSDVMSSAARVGDLSFVEVLQKHGGVLDENFSYYAARNAHLNLLIYFKEQGGQWHPNVTLAAVKGRNLECLKFVHESGNELETEWSSGLAIANEDVDILEYLHQNGCGLGYMQVLCSSWQTNFECMKYLLTHNNDWKDDIQQQIHTMNLYAESGSLEKIKFLRELGGSWDIEAMKKYCNGHKECLLYLNNVK